MTCLKKVVFLSSSLLTFICIIIIICFENINKTLYKFCAVDEINMENSTSDSFHIQLYSNVESFQSHRENTVANFVTKLPEKLVLSSDWEVGLAEISYTKTWYNIRENQSIGVFTSGHHIHQNDEAVLRAGYYKNIIELVEEINKLFNVFESVSYRKYIKRAPYIRYDRIVNPIYIIPGIPTNSDQFIYPYLSEGFEDILGFRFNGRKSFMSYFIDSKSKQFIYIDKIKLRKQILYESNFNDINLTELEYSSSCTI